MLLTLICTGVGVVLLVFFAVDKKREELTVKAAISYTWAWGVCQTIQSLWFPVVARLGATFGEFVTHTWFYFAPNIIGLAIGLRATRGSGAANT